MFTEYEVETFMQVPEVKELVKDLKRQFLKEEAQFFEISDHDFLSLILMTPPIGVANANGNISLFEELALNKLARKMSKGGYFLKADPVAHGMKYLIKSFDKWEETFLNAIKLCMNKTIDFDDLKSTLGDKEPSFDHLPSELKVVPYIFVRYLSSFFLPGGEDVVEQHNVSRVEYDKILAIGQTLGIDHLPFFKIFCTTFKVK
ncbi:MAG: hypothetical protein OEX02_03680 [Cyclobacteriaceae bacterium]|nr:hypothetical protein [Cyclobacteriaceae bacterium]